MSKPVSYETTATVILGLTFGIVFFDRNALNFLMPFVLREMALTNLQIGLLASGLALTWSLSGMIVGRLSDRLGRRKALLTAAVVVFSFSSFVTGLAASFIALLGARLLMGLAEGPVLPISQSLMAEASSPARRGLNMGLMQNVLSNLMGSLVAPLVVVTLATHFGWRPAFYVTAIPGLIAAVLIWLFIKDDAPGDHAERAQPAAGERLTLGDALLHHRNVRLCLLISPLMVGWMITGWVFLPIYFTRTAGFSVSEMSILMSTLGVSGALAGFVLPALSDRFGRRPVTCLGCLLGLLTPLAAWFGAPSAVALTILVATGWMAGGTFSIFMATIPAESAGAGQITTAMGLIMGLGELIGGAAAPAAVGWLSDRFGTATPLLAQMAFAGIAGLVALRLQETSPRVLARKRTAAPAP